MIGIVFVFILIVLGLLECIQIFAIKAILATLFVYMQSLALKKQGSILDIPMVIIFNAIIGAFSLCSLFTIAESGIFILIDILYIYAIFSKYDR